jgi:hypothetical protein
VTQDGSSKRLGHITRAVSRDASIVSFSAYPTTTAELVPSAGASRKTDARMRAEVLALRADPPSWLHPGNAALWRKSLVLRLESMPSANCTFGVWSFCGAAKSRDRGPLNRHSEFW